MSQDSGSRTEKPTARKLQRAREQGQVAKSQDLNAAISLAALALLVSFSGNYFYASLSGILQGTYQRLSTQALTVSTFGDLWTDALQTLIWLLVPMMLTVTTAAILINLVQIKPLFTTKPLEPKLDKLNPINGFKRIVSMRSMVESAKAIIKMAVLGSIASMVIMGRQTELMGLNLLDLPTALSLIGEILSQIALWSIAIFFVIGLIDWRYQAYELEKQLMMSKQDIKDERKETEGDPMIKSRIRQTAAQMARKRQMVSVPTADVVITNPTHFSVAIKYDPDLFPAPTVVAKGKDHVAMQIRMLAKEHGVPLMENKPLARSLYAAVDVDQMIPPDLFAAVAEVLAYVFARNKSRRTRPNSPAPRPSLPEDN
ncbi:MAG: flagellar biosynthesis protein FlhB [Candidatus Melainabacteria bacterium]|nr:flagellar biosynthesis protein FlhB [Candidatus Melainabacteria bacterium]